MNYIYKQDYYEKETNYLSFQPLIFFYVQLCTPPTSPRFPFTKVQTANGPDYPTIGAFASFRHVLNRWNKFYVLDIECFTIFILLG
jgi:hypothetical protein